MSPEERAHYDAEEARYRDQHPECRSHRWSVQGCITLHCGYCCPPPPIGPHQAERLSRLFTSFTKHPPHEYDEWELTLTCDHLVRARQHRSNGGWNNCGVVACPTCEITRGIVQSTLIGPAVGPEERPVVELQRLQAELEQAEKQAARRRAVADKAEQHLAALKSRLELSSAADRPTQALPEP